MKTPFPRPLGLRPRSGTSGVLALILVLIWFPVLALAQSDRVVITPEEGFSILWDGNNGGFYDPEIGAFAPLNDAGLAFPFASSNFQPGGFHDAFNVTDGFYGNSSSWISDFDGDPAEEIPPDEDPWIALDFGSAIEVGNIAWSRDNGDETEAACGGTCTDRAVGVYTLQYTLVEIPDELLEETGDPATGWVTIGTVEYLAGADDFFFTAHRRHRFELMQGDGPVTATGIRLKVSENTMAIDEIEVNTAVDEPLTNFLAFQASEGYRLTWDGENGAFFDFEDPAPAARHRGLSERGVMAFGSSEFGAGVHFVENVNDGFYGNLSAWLPAGDDQNPFIGLAFGESLQLDSIAWGRDNGNDAGDCCGGQLTDRALGTYTIQVTRVEAPGVDTGDTGDASTGWATVAVVEYRAALEGFFVPHLRHRFELSTEDGQPVEATGMRLLLSDAGLAIDELEVNPPLEIPEGAIEIVSEPGFLIEWDGNEGDFFSESPTASAPENDALGAVAFGSSEADFGGIHVIRNLNDGLYGNSKSWIAGFNLDPPDAAPFVGLAFGEALELESIAWSRDNGNNPGDCCGGQLMDRWQDVYTLAFTMVENPGVDTEDTGDASTGWQVIGSVSYVEASPPAFEPWLRHRFDLSMDGQPIMATGIRIAVTSNGTAIDEIEINPTEVAPPPIQLTAEGPFTMEWDGNNGAFFDEAASASAPSNAALAATAFGSSELDFGVHFIANINDGLYGNANSWIPKFTDPADTDPFIGLAFGGEIGIRSVAFGRDNGNNETDCCGGQLTDRALGVYTLQVTRVADPGVGTEDTGDASTGWVTVGVIDIAAETAFFKPWLRHRIDIAENGEPVRATGLRVRVPNNTIAIDELEVNPLEDISLRPADGFEIVFDGNEGNFNDPAEMAFAPDNAALDPGTLAFGSSELDFGVHFIRHVNDGRYGNSNSWIARFIDPVDTEPFVGLSFEAPVMIRSIAWGRDNGNTVADACGGTCQDRSLDTYLLQYTTLPNPDEFTPDSEDPADPSMGWVDIGEVQYRSVSAAFSPWLRHRFEVSSGGQPIEATGIRIRVTSPNTAIDEIEVNPADAPEPPEPSLEFEVSYDPETRLLTIDLGTGEPVVVEVPDGTGQGAGDAAGFFTVQREEDGSLTLLFTDDLNQPFAPYTAQ